ncbi:MAG: hypothetical protein AAGC55_23830 [Myxococcota bacterium]
MTLPELPSAIESPAAERTGRQSGAGMVRACIQLADRRPDLDITDLGRMLIVTNVSVVPISELAMAIYTPATHRTIGRDRTGM